MTGPRIPVTEGVSGTWAALAKTKPVRSPFDALRQIRADGTEFWSGRDLADAAEYEQWRNFAAAVDRARVALFNQGYEAENHIAGASKMVNLGSGAQRAVDDYHLTRLGAYLVVMNGDPRKPAIAAAQGYFAAKTRQAEMSAAAPALTGAELLAHAVLEAQSMLAAKDEHIAALEPKAEFYDQLMDADGAYTWAATANILGWGRNVMLRELRKLGVVQGNRLPYQRYAHHFKVVPGTYVHPTSGERIPCATTHVLPSGVEFLRRKLARSLELAVEA